MSDVMTIFDFGERVIAQLPGGPRWRGRVIAPRGGKVLIAYDDGRCGIVDREFIVAADAPPNPCECERQRERLARYVGKRVRLRVGEARGDLCTAILGEFHLGHSTEYGRRDACIVHVTECDANDGLPPTRWAYADEVLGAVVANPFARRVMRELSETHDIVQVGDIFDARAHAPSAAEINARAAAAQKESDERVRRSTKIWEDRRAALDRAARFLAGLDLTRHTRDEREERTAIVREIAALLGKS